MFNLRKKVKVNTDEKIIDSILDRYTHEILPTKDSLKEKLMSGKRLKIYLGVDPTGKDLHIGHGVAFFLMEEFRKLGHEIIILFGGFTATIGDPTDKTAARKQLTEQEVKENIKSWKDQISKIIRFDDSFNVPDIVNNNDWYSKMSLREIIELSTNFTVQNMIERDMFQERIKNEKPIFMHEFFYPILQGYDSVVLGVDVEVGGTDQTFNMLAGRTLLSKLKNKNKIVISIPLLANPKTGKKMSKSEGMSVAILDNPNDMFGKVMSLPDEMMIDLIRYTSDLRGDAFNGLIQKIKENKDPRENKISVAFQIVKTYHSEKDAENARENFTNTFSKKESLPNDVLEIKLESGKELGEIILDNKILSSKSEWRRLIDQGGVQNFETKEKISDPKYIVSETSSYKIGKKNFIKISF